MQNLHKILTQKLGRSLTEEEMEEFREAVRKDIRLENINAAFAGYVYGKEKDPLAFITVIDLSRKEWDEMLESENYNWILFIPKKDKQIINKHL